MQIKSKLIFTVITILVGSLILYFSYIFDLELVDSQLVLNWQVNANKTLVINELSSNVSTNTFQFIMSTNGDVSDTIYCDRYNKHVKCLVKEKEKILVIISNNIQQDTIYLNY